MKSSFISIMYFPNIKCSFVDFGQLRLYVFSVLIQILDEGHLRCDVSQQESTVLTRKVQQSV